MARDQPDNAPAAVGRRVRSLVKWARQSPPRLSIGAVEGGTYRLEFEVSPRTVPVREGDAALMGRRLAEYLPAEARLTDEHADAGANTIGAVVTLPARSPAEALARLTAAMENLAVNVRTEHGRDPLGPMPELRRVEITRAPDV